MTDSSPAFLVTRILGITTSAFLSGFAFSASYYTVPAIALAPLPLQLKQWKVVYDLGKLISPPVSVGSALLWGYAAWYSYSHDKESNSAGTSWKMYSAAGLLTLSVLFWTGVFMLPTNKDLMQREKISREVTSTEMLAFEKQSLASLKKWDGMNMVRAVLPMVGTIVGLSAALN